MPVQIVAITVDAIYMLHRWCFTSFGWESLVLFPFSCMTADKTQDDTI